jgi:hypothetical protein
MDPIIRQLFVRVHARYVRLMQRISPLSGRVKIAHAGASDCTCGHRQRS